MNPLLAVSTLPYQLPPFEAILPEHFREGLTEGMRLHRLEIEAIAIQAGPVDFTNTLVALERAGSVLARVSGIFWNLLAADGNDVLETIATEFSPKLAAHDDAILHDARLYARIRALSEKTETLGLDAEDRQLLQRYRLDFERAGAALGEADKRRLGAINTELASLAARFGQQLRKDALRLAPALEDRAPLEGLGEAAIAAAHSAALEHGLAGGYLLPLQSPSQQPALSQLRRRDMRERLLAASLARGASGGEFDNRAVIAATVSLRAERAQLLGYRNHAQYVLDDTSAKTPERVDQFLGELVPRVREQVQAEAQALQAFIAARGEELVLEAQDWAFYAEEERRALHRFDEDTVRPYLELARVLRDGVFFAAERLYGVRFELRTDLRGYHPDVEIFEVLEDLEGKTRPLALFMTDYYARPSKRGGAWSTTYVEQSELFGVKAVVCNCLNIQKPPAGAPTLLTLAEVATLFHEFGHALHSMFSEVRYPKLSGTRVAPDFVEFPSKFNEMWALWPEVLSHYARHVETGAGMPEELLQKVRESQTFRQGMETAEYLAAALLDMAWHEIEAPVTADAVEPFEAEALERAGIALPAIPPRYRSGYFKHIFDGGYAAGYYAYLWSEVLDADAGRWIAEEGGLLRANGDWLRAQILSRGASADADLLFRRFRGRDPRPDAMLERRGLASPACPDAIRGTGRPS